MPITYLKRHYNPIFEPPLAFLYFRDDWKSSNFHNAFAFALLNSSGNYNILIMRNYRPKSQDVTRHRKNGNIKTLDLTWTFSIRIPYQPKNIVAEV